MRTSTGASFYYTMDGLGSIILLTDSAQAAAATYAYDSWGLATTAAGAQAATNPWTYAGGYNDTTSNRIKFGARYYNPYRGRFTQVDPSGQETNRYAYVNCNPINATDPSGLFSLCQTLTYASIGTGVIGLVAAVGAIFATGTIVGIPAGAALTGFSIGLGALSVTYGLMALAVC